MCVKRDTGTAHFRGAQECDNRAALRASTEGLPVIARRFKRLHDTRVVKVSLNATNE